MKTVLSLGHDGMGHGDAALGQRVLANFLRKSNRIRGLTAVLLFNSGVRLAAADSAVLVELRQLHEAGVDVKPCGTCVDHYGLRDALAVGEVSSMDDLIEELDRADKIISL